MIVGELFAAVVLVGGVVLAFSGRRAARERKLGGTITNIGFGEATISPPRKFRH